MSAAPEIRVYDYVNHGYEQVRELLTEDAVAVFQAALLLAHGEALGGFVVPAPLAHEFIPDLDLLLRGAISILIHPVENRLIVIDRLRLFHHAPVINSQE